MGSSRPYESTMPPVRASHVRIFPLASADTTWATQPVSPANQHAVRAARRAVFVVHNGGQEGRSGLDMSVSREGGPVRIGGGQQLSTRKVQVVSSIKRMMHDEMMCMFVVVCVSS